MKRSKLLKTSVLFTLLSVVGLGALVYAQDVIPTPANPLPDELVGIDAAFKYLTDASPWYIAAAFIVFLVVAFLRGKLTIGSWPIRIPKFHDWLDTTGSKFRFWAIIILTGVGMGLYNLSKCTTWTAKEIIINFLLGVPSGVVLALAAMGVAAGKDVHTDPKHTTEPATPAAPKP